MIRETPPDNKAKIIHKSIEMVLYFPYSNSKNREKNKLIYFPFYKKGEGSRFLFPIF